LIFLIFGFSHLGFGATNSQLEAARTSLARCERRAERDRERGQDPRSCERERERLERERERLQSLQEAQLRQNQNSQQSARSIVKDKEKKNYLGAVAAGGASAILFYQANAHAASQNYGMAAAYFGMGALAAAQAVKFLQTSSRDRQTGGHVQTGGGGGQIPPDDPPPDGPERERPQLPPAFTRIEQILSERQGQLTPDAAHDISQAIGCDYDCIGLDGEGNPQAQDRKGQAISEDHLNIPTEQKKAINSKVMAQLKKDYPKLMKDLLEQTDPNEKFSKSSLIASAMAGDTETTKSSKANFDPMAHMNKLLDQFLNKNQKQEVAGKTITLGNDQVGNIQDNIFFMVHRRYQERRSKKQFIKPKTRISHSQKNKM